MSEYNINYVHLGGDIIVNKKDIVGIFDIALTGKSKTTKNFLNKCIEDGFVTKITDEETRAFVLVKINEKRNTRNKYNNLIVYYSPISSLTLQKRACLSY